MKHIGLFTFLALSVLLTACTHMKVSSEGDPDYRFSRISTYQWIEPPAELMENDEACLDLRMQKALNNELAALGWKQVLDATNASVEVTYCINIKSHAEFTETKPDNERDFSGGLVFDRNNNEWNYEQQEPNRIEYRVETGTFHLIINDAASGNRVWHGSVETEIDRALPPDEQEELFRQVARKISEELSEDLR